MRVLHIGKYYPPFAGGMENFLGDLLPAQKSLDLQAGVLVHNHAVSKADYADKPFVLKEQAGKSTLMKNIWRVPCYGSLLYTPISPQFPVWLKRVIDDFEPEVLHLHLPNVSAFWVMLLKRSKRLPWVVHWHADVVASKIDRRLSFAYQFYKPFEQRLLAKCQAIVATSPPYLSTSSALSKWHQKTQVIPLGLDPTRLPLPKKHFTAWAKEQWGGAALKVLAVGRLTYYKGHEVLVRAVAGMKNVKLILVGEGDQRQALEKLIVSLGIEQRVSLLGGQPRPELAALMATSSCVCMPSIERTEAFGLVLLEAMRYGKPLVVSDIEGSGMGWVVKPDETGILVPPGDVDKLRVALLMLQDKPEMQDRIGKAGNKRFQEYFHIMPVAQQIKEVYEEVIRNGV